MSPLSSFRELDHVTEAGEEPLSILESRIYVHSFIRKKGGTAKQNPSSFFYEGFFCVKRKS
ncbi:hypothetical protein BLX87_17025 [Bacillus sp. VT-16-64]|nr:hypothetical protein BLX87_17025 [Bacillus sp. VT-16-64]